MMSNRCKQIHALIEQLPIVKWRFEPKHLPKCGVYFFYENSEVSSHPKSSYRIVRVGTHLKNNFRSRIKNHYVFKEQISFTKDQSAPHDRSIFRNHIGRCLLNKERKEQYVNSVWIKNKNPLDKRNKYKHLRDIDTEIRIENTISEIIKRDFFFRYILFEDEQTRIGADSIESAIIATVAQCEICKPSKNWLGNFSTDKTVRDSGIWNVRCTNEPIINDLQYELLLNAIKNTKKFLNTA